MHRSITNRLHIAVVAGVGIIASFSASAAPIVLGSIATPAQGFGGTNLVSSGAAFATPAGPAAFSGNFFSQVWTNDPTNPYGGLTFVYQANSNVTSLALIERITSIDFTGLLTDVSYFDPGGPPVIAPSTTTRTATSTIGWNFPSGVAAGETTAQLVIRTNATGYLLSTAFLIDGQVTSVNAVGPDVSQVVPEPAGIGAIVALTGLLARRRKASVAA